MVETVAEAVLFAVAGHRCPITRAQPLLILPEASCQPDVHAMFVVVIPACYYSNVAYRLLIHKTTDP
jgi:hypothetical protein